MKRQKTAATDKRIEEPPLKLAWSIAALARACGVCRDLIYRDIATGKLLAKRIGARRTIVTDEEARRWLNGLPTLRLPVTDEPQDAA
jgi:hypothetical protein